jgi:serine/threonine protein kinase
VVWRVIYLQFGDRLFGQMPISDSGAGPAEAPGGITIPGYLLGAGIGEGSFGVVVRATHIATKRRVAIKV